MDDINLSCLTEAKNEYSARLVNILTPCIAEGVQSIFQEAWQLCHENDELTKYLITFQNFLVRIPKWNQTIIEEESQRIVSKSNCNYLEDLITCVHICQLKILTSIRVGTKQKKIELDVPRLSDFIHKVYIQVARKLYKNVYLFERGIPALERQKHQREFEIIIQESILNTVRDSIPTDKILRAYIDQTSEIEEEVEEYTIEKEKIAEPDSSKNENNKHIDASNETQPKLSKETLAENKEPEFKNTINVTKEENHDKQHNYENIKLPDISDNSSSKTIDISNNSPETPENEHLKETVTNDNSAPSITMDIQTEKTTPIEPSVKTPEFTDKEPKVQTLQFNDTDQVLNMDTNRREEVEAPKTIDHLEELGRQREAERNDDDDDEETLKILDDAEDVKLDVEDLKEEPEIELDIQEMPTL